MQEVRTIVDEVRDYVVSKISDDLPDEITYHTIGHTIDVVQSVLEIARKQKISSEKIEAIEIAAWFHDIGYVDGMKNHEERGATIAGSFLESRGYPSSGIALISGCILATKMPQNPTNQIERIICDADMMHLAKEDYFAKSELLHREMQVTKECDISEREWLEMNQNFLNDHCFFTDYAKKTYASAVKNNLKKVRGKLRKWKQTTK